MNDKPEIVKQYERRKDAGESLYFDPVELEDIFHYYAEEGRSDKEEEVLRLARELHPDDFVTGTLEAEFALNMDDADACLRYLEPIFDEDNIMHCILMSGALAQKGDLPRAIDYGEMALEGDDPLIAYDVGLGFMNAGQPTVALRYYSRCLEAYPDDLRTLQGILYCLGQVGTPEEVIRYADRALEIDSFCVEAWLAKGNALGEQGKWKEAEECCDYAMAIQPENGDCILMKVNCCVQQNRHDEALHFAEEAASRVYNEAKANVLLLAAHLYGEKNQMEEARKAVWGAVEACPLDRDILNRAIYAFVDSGAPAPAIALLQDRMRREGEKTEPHFLMLLGEQLTQQGDYEAALEPYELLVKIAPSPTSWTMLAGTYMSLNKYRKAYKYLQLACAEDPMWQTYVLTAVCAHEMGWETAAGNNYILAYNLNAKGAFELLQALSPMLIDSFREKKIFEQAEQWRQQNLVKELLKAEARQKEYEQSEPEIEMEEINTKDNKKTK